MPDRTAGNTTLNHVCGILCTWVPEGVKRNAMGVAVSAEDLFLGRRDAPRSYTGKAT